jgi:hypothetical protein
MLRWEEPDVSVRDRRLKISAVVSGRLAGCGALRINLNGLN